MKKIIFGAMFLMSNFVALEAFALASFGTALDLKYGKTLYGGSCSVCHNSTNDDPTWFSLYGSMLKQAGADDDFGITPYLTAVESFDYDNDGFTTLQEINGNSFNGGSFVGTPKLTTPDKNIGSVSAKTVNGGAVSSLSLAPMAGVLGGTVTFTSPYNSVANATTSTNFMFAAGGAQTGATVAFYANNNTVITQTATNTADGSGVANIADGSVNIIIKDEGVFDLYTTAVFQQVAIDRYTAFTPATATDPYASISPYATISPYAKVSSLATVEPYAFIAAYAVVDDYAVVGAYAKIGSYAYVAAHVDLYTGTDMYTQVTLDKYAQATASVNAPKTIAVINGIGYISAKFAVTTPAPLKRTAPSYGGGGGENGESSGGLHCMTSGLGAQGLMLFSLLFATLLVRRKSK